MKLKRAHPHKQMLHGRHVVGMEAQNFELDEAEEKNLKAAGPAHWFEVGKPIKDVAATAPKKTVKKKENLKDDKKDTKAL